MLRAYEPADVSRWLTGWLVPCSLLAMLSQMLRAASSKPLVMQLLQHLTCLLW